MTNRPLQILKAMYSATGYTVLTQIPNDIEALSGPQNSKSSLANPGYDGSSFAIWNMWYYQLWGKMTCWNPPQAPMRYSWRRPMGQGQVTCSRDPNICRKTTSGVLLTPYREWNIKPWVTKWPFGPNHPSLARFCQTQQVIKSGGPSNNPS